MPIIAFEIKLVAPVPSNRVKFNGASWVSNTKTGFDSAEKGIDAAIKRTEDVVEMVANPEIKELLTKLGKTSMERLKETLRRNDGVSKVDRSVERSAGKYEQGRSDYWFPIFGSAKNKPAPDEVQPKRGAKKFKGLAVLGLMALTGDKRLKKWLKKDCDYIVVNKPICICEPEKLTEFKNGLWQHLTESGTALIKGGINERAMTYHNGLLNKLVDSYRRPEFAPFTPGGDSHVNFVVYEFNSSLVQKSNRSMRLGLDIRVALAETTENTEKTKPQITQIITD